MGARAMTSSSAIATVIIPNWNGGEPLTTCLRALRSQTRRDFELVVVDNGSTDDSIARVRAMWPEARVIRNAVNRGFAIAANQGIAAATTPYVALLNNDTAPHADWLEALVNALENAGSEVGSAASLMLQMERPDLVDSAGDELTRHGFAHKRGHGLPAGGFAEPCEVLSACAGAALYRRAFLEKAGGFDETFFAYLEDVDLGLRGQWLGYKCLFVPGARVLHRGHGSKTPQGRYVRWSARNRLLLIVKNWPRELFAHGWYHLIYGQFYLCIAQRRPLHFIMGCASFVRHLPYALTARRRIMAQRQVSSSRIMLWLREDPGEPPLYTLLGKRRNDLEGTPP